MDSPDLDDQLEADVYTNLPSSTASGITTRRRNRSSFKSKHSETEQRRRSKINERFQSLMDIIPQNDQKRDKASFLLEVIEYIHFLQDKVVMYEGSHQMWHQSPTKLIPWRNNQGSLDHTQILQSFLSNDQVAADPNADSLASTNILEHCPLSAVSSYIPTEPVPQFLQPEFWQPRPSSESVNCNKNEMPNSGENPPAIMSTVCSQRVLHSLTEALKSSGVDMSETMISVNLSVRKRSDREYSVPGLASKDNGNSIADEEADFPTVTTSLCKDLDNSESLKKTRR